MFAMEKKQQKGRWFLIKHECGAKFTINTEKIIDSFAADTGYHPLICPGCFKPITDKMKNELIAFCKHYTRAINALQEGDFKIKETEIIDEDSDF
jgi:hypothetical protein